MEARLGDDEAVKIKVEDSQEDIVGQGQDYNDIESDRHESYQESIDIKIEDSQYGYPGNSIRHTSKTGVERCSSSRQAHMKNILSTRGFSLIPLSGPNDTDSAIRERQRAVNTPTISFGSSSNCDPSALEITAFLRTEATPSEIGCFGDNTEFQTEDPVQLDVPESSPDLRLTAEELNKYENYCVELVGTKDPDGSEFFHGFQINDVEPGKFACDACDDSGLGIVFKNKSSLVQHIKFAHLGMTPAKERILKAETNQNRTPKNNGPTNITVELIDRPKTPRQLEVIVTRKQSDAQKPCISAIKHLVPANDKVPEQIKIPRPRQQSVNKTMASDAVSVTRQKQSKPEVTRNITCAVPQVHSTSEIQKLSSDRPIITRPGTPAEKTIQSTNEIPITEKQKSSIKVKGAVENVSKIWNSAADVSQTPENMEIQIPSLILETALGQPYDATEIPELSANISIPKQPDNTIEIPNPVMHAIVEENSVVIQNCLIDPELPKESSNSAPILVSKHTLKGNAQMTTKQPEYEEGSNQTVLTTTTKKSLMNEESPAAIVIPSSSAETQKSKYTVMTRSDIRKSRVVPFTSGKQPDAIKVTVQQPIDDNLTDISMNTPIQGSNEKQMVQVTHENDIQLQLDKVIIPAMEPRNNQELDKNAVTASPSTDETLHSTCTLSATRRLPKHERQFDNNISNAIAKPVQEDLNASTTRLTRKRSRGHPQPKKTTGKRTESTDQLGISAIVTRKRSTDQKQSQKISDTGLPSSDDKQPVKLTSSSTSKVSEGQNREQYPEEPRSSPQMGSREIHQVNELPTVTEILSSSDQHGDHEEPQNKITLPMRKPKPAKKPVINLTILTRKRSRGESQLEKITTDPTIVSIEKKKPDKSIRLTRERTKKEPQPSKVRITRIKHVIPDPQPDKSMTVSRISSSDGDRRPQAEKFTLNESFIVETQLDEFPTDRKQPRNENSLEEAAINRIQTQVQIQKQPVELTIPTEPTGGDKQYEESSKACGTLEQESPLIVKDQAKRSIKVSIRRLTSEDVARLTAAKLIPTFSGSESCSLPKKSRIIGKKLVRTKRIPSASTVQPGEVNSPQLAQANVENISPRAKRIASGKETPIRGPTGRKKRAVKVPDTRSRKQKRSIKLKKKPQGSPNVTLTEEELAMYRTSLKDLAVKTLDGKEKLGQYELKQLEDGKYMCSACPTPKIYFNKYTLSTHIKIRHMGFSHSKLEMSRKLKRKNDEPRVVKEKNGSFTLGGIELKLIEDGWWSCGQCGHRVRSKYNIGNHIKSQHLDIKKKAQKPKYYGPKTLRQQIMGKTVTTEDGRKFYEGVEVIPVPENLGQFRCGECSKPFIGQGSVLTHIKKRHMNFDSPKLVPCPTCGKRFPYLHLLRTHETIHSEAQYKCDQCSGRYKTRGALRSHKARVHENIRKHKCFHCDKMFHTNKDRTRHLYTHAELNLQKPYICFCSAAFSQPSSLIRHKAREGHNQQEWIKQNTRTDCTTEETVSKAGEELDSKETAAKSLRGKQRRRSPAKPSESPIPTSTKRARRK